MDGNQKSFVRFKTGDSDSDEENGGRRKRKKAMEARNKINAVMRLKFNMG